MWKISGILDRVQYSTNISKSCWFFPLVNPVLSYGWMCQDHQSEHKKIWQENATKFSKHIDEWLVRWCQLSTPLTSSQLQSHKNIQNWKVDIIEEGVSRILQLPLQPFEVEVDWRTTSYAWKQSTILMRVFRGNCSLGPN